MSLPRFFLDERPPDAFEEGAVVELSPEDARHALRSLRMRVGDRLTVSDDGGRVADATVSGVGGGVATVMIGVVRRVERPVPCVRVAMAPPKGDRLSWATQKLAELGVDELQLVTTDRAVRTGERDRTLERQTRIAREAAMQARRPFVTSIRADRFEEDLAPSWARTDDLVTSGRELRLLLWEHADIPIRAAWTEAPEGVRILVGPEGSFTDREVELAGGGGFVAVSLGDGILRTETAAVVGAALVLARYGRLG